VADSDDPGPDGDAPDRDGREWGAGEPVDTGGADEWDVDGPREDSPVDEDQPDPENDEPDAEGIFGPTGSDGPIEPGRPDPEHVAFVLLGALTTVLGLLDLVGVV
jgi:hypothetical protein